ncbi:MAG TPA: creatininase family protein [Methylomirabilota bacterium]|jgi:creatinine amidohydrolase/Fe(II)-dependent formamide hydrolase-like protein|nr:creatininase family protein [Methylomirabilota bacterium]
MRSKALGIISCLFLLCAGPACAQAPDTVYLEELTWTELRALIASQSTTIIVPVGGTEQNGPHMALGKHNVRVKALSEKIARALGHTLVAPVIAYVPEGQLSPATEHMRFPGTITVPDESFQKVIEYAARSFKLHGFKDIVYLGDHGGTQAAQKAVAGRLNREWAKTPFRVHAIEEYYRAADAEFPRLLKGRGYREDEVGNHAGLADTALMLAVDPRLVRADRLRPGAGQREASGVSGDPSRASAELGQPGVELIVTRTVDAIRKSMARR